MKYVLSAFIVSNILIYGTLSAKGNPYVKVGIMDGSIKTYEFLKYDKNSMEFEFRQAKEKARIKVKQIKFIVLDTIGEIPVCTFGSEGSDIIKLKGGNVPRGIFRKMDKDKVTVFSDIRSSDDLEIKLADLEYICFNSNILNIERFEYGEGFNLLSREEEIQMALAYADDVGKSTILLKDTLIENYIDSLGKYIGKHSKWPDLDFEFSVINDDVINAFTPGAGQVFIYRGLIEQMGSEAELAGVIGHEIGHSIGRHTSKQLSKQLLYGGVLGLAGGILNSDKNKWAETLTDVGGVVAFFGLMKFSRDEEREADLLGFYNLYEAGIHPKGMISLFETFSRVSSTSSGLLESWSSSHPPSDERKQNMTEELRYVDAEGFIEDSDRFQWVKEYLTALPPPEQLTTFWVDTFEVVAGNYLYKEFIVDQNKMKNCRLFGRFFAQYGNEYNDIRFLILDEVNFVNWSRGNKSLPLLDTEKTSIYDIAYKFPQTGKYYIVFDNSYSTFTPKTVVSAVYLGYTNR